MNNQNNAEMMRRVRYLLTYRYTMLIHDMTVTFTKAYILSSVRHLSNLGQKPDYRQADQMDQAARSGKQNIVEGVGQSETSKRGEIKLLGVAMASLEELLEDYEDFLRQHNFRIYPKTDPKVTAFRKTAYRLSNLSNLSPLGEFIEKPTLSGDPETDANFLLTLCHQATYLLHKQIKALEERFVTSGGFTEGLYKKRMEFRSERRKTKG